MAAGDSLTGLQRRFQNKFKSHHEDQVTNPCVHDFLTNVLHTTVCPSNWLLFHIDCQPIGGRRIRHGALQGINLKDGISVLFMSDLYLQGICRNITKSGN